MKLIPSVVTAALIGAALGSMALAQSRETTPPPMAGAPAQFVPFDQFIAETAAAPFNGAAPAKLASTAAFAEMRQHLLDLYEGVHVTHSFVQGSQTFDCVPAEQQPSVRMLGLKRVASPPADSMTMPAGAPSATTAQGPAHTSELRQAWLIPSASVDEFGNATACEEHTVPIQRATLEQMSRFPTLRAFLSKQPNGQRGPRVTPGRGDASLPTASTLSSPLSYQYNYVYQFVSNKGGSSTLNIWSPPVYVPWGEVHSMSQVWYTGMSTSGEAQTVEGGWQVAPEYYNDLDSHLFVSYTADGYRTGCQDNLCGAFVQTNHTVSPGMRFRNYSRDSGTQAEVQIQYLWYQGNWWIEVGNTWLGYYPGTLYGQGEMATHATRVTYGGEILSRPIVSADGSSYYFYPEMGSGWNGSLGYQRAAYQRLIAYYNDSANPTLTSPTLTAVNTCPGGTTLVGPSFTSNWGTYFFFGGAGGLC